MILKKTIQNEKTVYAPITFEEAIKDRDEKDDLIFTDDDEKKNFDDILAQIEKAESQATNESEKNDQSASVDGDDEDDDDTVLSWDTVKSALKQAGQFAKKGIHVVDASLGNLFSGLSGEKSKKANKLMEQNDGKLTSRKICDELHGLASVFQLKKDMYEKIYTDYFMNNNLH